MRRLFLCLPFLANPALAEVDIRQLVIDTARASSCVITEDIADATCPRNFAAGLRLIPLPKATQHRFPRPSRRASLRSRP